jgi:hypothetical protein
MATSGGLLATCGVPPFAAPHATCSPAFNSFFTGEFKAVRSTPRPHRSCFNHARRKSRAYTVFRAFFGVFGRCQSFNLNRKLTPERPSCADRVDFANEPADHFRLIPRHENQEQVNAGHRVRHPRLRMNRLEFVFRVPFVVDDAIGPFQPSLFPKP